MRRRFTLIGALLAFATFTLNAQQMTLTMSNATVPCDGDGSFSVAVTTSDIDLAGIQFSVNWDADDIDYQDSELVINGGLGTIGDALTDNGILTLTWINGTNVDFDEGDTILTIDFVATAGVGSYPIEITDNPTSIEASQEDLTVVDVSVVNGTLTVIDDEAPDITCPADITVAEPFQGAGGVTVNNIAPASITDNCGVETVTYDITGATSGSGADDASGTFFNVGISTVTYEATDAGDNTDDCSFSVQVDPASNGGDPDTVYVSVSTETAECDGDAVVSVSVNSFVDLTSLTFSLAFDEGILDYTSVTDNFPSGTPTVDDSQAFSGTLGLSWTGGPLTLSDGVVIYEVTFDVVGAAGSASDVDVTGSPVAISAANADGAVVVVATDGSVSVEDNTDPQITCPDDLTVTTDPGETSVTVNNIDPTASDNCDLDAVAYDLTGATTGSGDDDASGTAFNIGVTTVTYTATDSEGNEADCSFTVTVNEGSVPQSDTLMLVVPDVNIECDGQATVNVVVYNFNDINGIQFSFNFDETLLSYVSHSTDFPNGNVAVNPLDAANGNITLSWADDEETTIANGSAIFSVVFDALGDAGDVAAVGLSDNPVVIEVSNFDGLLPYIVDNGEVTIEDSTDPEITCPDDLTVTLDPQELTAVVNDIDPTASDNCALEGVTYEITGATTASGDDDASGTEFNIGVSTVSYTATDLGGNEASCSFTVTLEPTVTDTLVLVAGSADVSCGDTVTVPITVADFVGIGGLQFSVGWNPDLIEYIDAEPNFPNDGILEENEMNVAGGMYAVSWADDEDFDLDSGTVILEMTFYVSALPTDCSPFDIVDDPVPVEASSAEFLVVVPVDITNGEICITGDLPPVAVCQDITIELDADGAASITGADIDGGSYDLCGLDTLVAQTTDFDCDDLGDNDVELVAIDVSGGTDTCVAVVTVEDNIVPSPLCHDITTYLDGDGNASITADDVDAGSTDNCPITLSIDVSEFDCGDSGDNTVILTVTDASDNSAVCMATVTVLDTISPVALCQDLTVYLDGDGAAILDAGDVDNGSSDNCDIATMTLDDVTLNCDDRDSTTVTLTVTDSSDNSASCTATVQVLDTIAPILTVPADITVECDNTGGAPTPVSSLSGELTTDDPQYGRSTGTISCTSTTPEDHYYDTFTFVVTEDDTYTLTCDGPADLYGALYEGSFDPTDVCTNWIAADDDGAGGLDPEIEITLFMSAGEYILVTTTWGGGVTGTYDWTFTSAGSGQLAIPSMSTGDDIDPVNTGFATATDNCTDSVAITYSDGDFDFACGNTGTVTRTWTAEDEDGNTSTGAQQITVEDNTPPVAVCDDITLELDENGEGVLAGSDVDGGSSDACGGTLSFDVDITDFNCDDVGDQDVVLTVTDACDNSSTCDATVTVADNMPPIAVCVDITVQLESNDQVFIEPSDLDGGSSDNCGVASLAASQTMFGIPDLGDNTVILTVTDVNGNESTCEANVEVFIFAPPELACPADFTIGTDEDQCAATFNLPLPTVLEDGCGGLVLSNNINGTSNDPVVLEPGDHIVTWTGTDTCGYSGDCSFTITVVDDVPPILTCPEDQTVTLDAGECGYFFNYIEPFATDNCESTITTEMITTTFNDNNQFAGNMFDFENVTSSPVTITMFDVNITGTIGSTGNVSVYYTPGTYVGNETNAGAWTLLGTTDVTVQGIGNPTPTPVGGLVLQPGESFGIYVYLNSYGTSGQALRYTNGNNTYNDGNVEIRTGIGRGDPLFSGSVFLSRTWNGTIHYSYGAAGDITVERLDNNGFNSGDFFPIGEHVFEYKATDFSGNMTTCTWEFVVEEYPFPISALVCNDEVNLSLDGNCEGTVTADMVLEGGPYGCYDDYIITIEDMNGISQGVVMTSNDVGNTYIVTVTDPETGNSCWTYLNIEDKQIPALECSAYEVSCSLDPLPGTTTDAVLAFADEPALATQDLQTVTSDFEVNTVDENILDIDVAINFTHTWVGDLVVSLTSPEGTTVQLFNNIGGPGFGCAGDNLALVFDDEAEDAYSVLDGTCNNLPAAEGTFQPIEPLSAFDGENPNGTWTVSVEDLAIPDGGTLDEIVLSIFLPNSMVIPFPVPGDATTTQLGDQSYRVTDFDPCSDVTLSYWDEVQDFGCSGDYQSIVYRHWTAVDASGNSTSCSDTISVKRATISELNLPPSYNGVDAFALECGTGYNPALPFGPSNWDANQNGYPDVEETGVPAGGCSNVLATYNDIELVSQGCDGGLKIIRRWTLYDWCTNESDVYAQTIKVDDSEGPVIVCPEELQVNTGQNNCVGVLSVPPPFNIYDNCSNVTGYTVEIDAGTVIDYGGGSIVVNDLPVGQHNLVYVAYDDCGNESRCTTIVNVVDNVAPVAICDINTRVSLGSDGIALIHAETFDDGSYDNCGVITDLQVRRKEFGDCEFALRQNDRTWKDAEEFCCEDVDDNPILVEMRVIDASGNINTCWVSVEVEDKLPPYAQPPQDVTVSCDFPFDIWGLDIFGHVVRPEYGETREVHTIDDPSGLGVTEILDGYATDNCLVIVEERDPRLDLECGQGTITRLWTIYDMDDENGNGQYEEDSDPVTIAQRITIVDFEPFYICDRLSREKPFDDINRCNKPLPHTNYDDVEWPADIRLDECPTDVLSLAPEHLAESNLRNEITRQPVSLDAYPTVNDDNCSQIAVLYDDEVFTVVPDACFKILRHWSIIDWCQYNVNTGEGRWEWTQVIKVLDEEPPVFVACEDVTFCDTAAVGCTGFADLTPEIMECSPEEYRDWEYRIYAFEDAQEPFFCNNHVDMDVDINDITNEVTVTRAGVINSQVVADDIVYSTNNGASFQPYFVPFVINNREDLLIIRTVEYGDGCATDVTFYGRSGDASRYYPFGTHKVQWRVEDMCGNVETCEYNFTVEDCKLPTPVCINGLSTVVMPSAGFVVIEAESFDASSYDNCTPNEDLIFTFSEEIINDTMTFTCDDLGTVEVEIWVTDEYGNQDYCTTFIRIEDPNDVCGDVSSSIAGIVEDEIGQRVEYVEVSLETDAMNMNPYMTDETGAYAFQELPDFNSYEVIPGKNIEPLNGVTTFDLALIQRHILGLEFLETPYKLIAADANDDDNINVLDIIDIRKLILGLYDELPNNTSWRFVDAEQQFPNGMQQPPADFDETILFTNLIQDATNTNFVGVKVGDVSNDASPNNAAGGVSRSYNGSLEFIVNNTAFAAGQDVRMAVTSENFNDILGYQFTMAFDANTLVFKGIETGALDVTEGNFGTQMADRGLITTSWNDVEGVSIAADEVLFTLVFEALDNGQTKDLITANSAITLTEAYGSEGIMDVSFGFDADDEVLEVFTLYQNTPNPFIESTVVAFNMPYDTDATITIFSLTGQVMKTIQGEFVKGYNEIELTKSQIGAAGIYYYQLETDEFTATKKMIIE